VARWTPLACIGAACLTACGSAAVSQSSASTHASPSSATTTTISTTAAFDPCVPSLVDEISTVLQAPAGAHRDTDHCGYSARSGILTLTFSAAPAGDASAAVTRAAHADGGTTATTHAVAGIGTAAAEVTPVQGTTGVVAIAFTTSGTLVNMVFKPSSFRPIRLDVSAFETLARHIAALVP